jgi:hypothetical protein
MFYERENIITFLNSNISSYWKIEIISEELNEQEIINLLLDEYFLDEIEDDNNRKVLYDIYFRNDRHYNNTFLKILESLDAPDEYKKEKFMNSLEKVEIIKTTMRIDPSDPTSELYSYKKVTPYYQVSTQQDIETLKQISFLSEEDKEELLQKYGKENK